MSAKSEEKKARRARLMAANPKRDHIVVALEEGCLDDIPVDMRERVVTGLTTGWIDAAERTQQIPVVVSAVMHKGVLLKHLAARVTADGIGIFTPTDEDIAAAKLAGG